jgi:hypothetical protein
MEISSQNLKSGAVKCTRDYIQRARFMSKWDNGKTHIAKIQAHLTLLLKTKGLEEFSKNGKRTLLPHQYISKPRVPGTREKVSSRRINLEGNTHVQEINVSQLPV